MRKILIILTLSLISCTLISNESIKTSKLFVIPTSGYSNETGITIGGLVYYSYRPTSRLYSLPPDSHYIQPLVTFKNQWQLNYRSNFYLKNDQLYLTPQIDYEVWPSSFYGFGNNTLKYDEEKYTNNRFSFRFGVANKINRLFAISLMIERDNYHLSDFEENRVLSTKNIAGSENYNLNSIGLGLIYDTRNIALYPTKGSYHQVEVNQAIDILGGNYKFTQYKLDLRKYSSFNPQHVFAIQGYISHIDNKAPFQKLNNLGKKIRGYETNRYIDNSLVILRGEYRLFPWSTTIFSRLGSVFFLESSQVASHLDKFKLNETKFSYGAGLRITLIPDEKMNLRVDLGISQDIVDIQVTTYEIF